MRPQRRPGRGDACQPARWFSPKPYRGPRSPLRSTAAQQPAQWYTPYRPQLFRIPSPGWSGDDEQPAQWSSPQRFRSPGRRRDAFVDRREWFEPDRTRFERSPLGRGAAGDAERRFEPQWYRDFDAGYDETDLEESDLYGSDVPSPLYRDLDVSPSPVARQAAAWNWPSQPDFLPQFGFARGREPAPQFYSLESDVTDEDSMEGGGQADLTYQDFRPQAASSAKRFARNVPVAPADTDLTYEDFRPLAASSGKRFARNVPTASSDTDLTYDDFRPLAASSGKRFARNVPTAASAVDYTPLLADIPDESHYLTIGGSRSTLSESEESGEHFHTAHGFPYGHQPIGSRSTLSESEESGEVFHTAPGFPIGHQPIGSRSTLSESEESGEEFHTAPGFPGFPYGHQPIGEDLTYDDFHPPVASTPRRYWEPEGISSDESVSDAFSARIILASSSDDESRPARRVPMYHWK